MQTREQYILGKIAEEASEVAQRAIKARDYGLDEVQEGKTTNNAERLVEEFYDLVSRLRELESLNPLLVLSSEGAEASFYGKAEQREKYLQLSRTLGRTE